MSIELKDITINNKNEFTAMYKDFYSSPATLHDVTDEHINMVFQNAITDKTYSRALIVYADNKVAGYLMLSFTYSGEVAGIQLLMEELYIKPEFQGQGIGSKVFAWVFEEYKNKVKRYRLEVTKSNRAKKMYERIGFEELDYIQMIYDIK